MKKLVIKDINNYDYTLIDSFSNKFNLNIEFYGLDSLPKKLDVIYMNEKLLNNVNNNLVSFGPLDEIYGKTIKNEDDKDLIILNTNNKNIYLKRFYG